MSVLAGMVQPDEGEIRIDGAPIRIASPKRAIELGIGMVYQHTTLVPTLTALDNLMMGDGAVAPPRRARGPRRAWPRSRPCSASRSTPTRRPAR